MEAKKLENPETVRNELRHITPTISWNEKVVSKTCPVEGKHNVFGSFLFLIGIFGQCLKIPVCSYMFGYIVPYPSFILINISFTGFSSNGYCIQPCVSE